MQDSLLAFPEYEPTLTQNQTLVDDYILWNSFVSWSVTKMATDGGYDILTYIVIDSLRAVYTSPARFHYAMTLKKYVKTITHRNATIG